MPGLVQQNAQFGNGCQILPSMSGSVSADGIWSRHRGDVTFDQLQKFWSELSPQTRQQLLRIDKHTLFEQARKNLYCSRCNGLLLEGFSQIVMYGRSLQQEGSQDEIQDPSVHPWGGLAATRDGILTLLDCFLNGNSLKLLQNVFDSSRARERERELLYPDACGGEGRGWISQGVATYGRGHGSRETCALHTARLSCDTLVDFWSALGDETRQSLLQMKEEDFIERLMYRFDSKRFCRDCRKNVIREFKELKELKRMRREPRCTSWFCAADTAFQYEVSDNAVLADWHQSFADTVGSYHRFELAVGTGEGKSDILEFKDVGMSESVEEEGLELGGLSSCFITLRAWKLDGRCTELSVKAYALKGRPCVHRRLIVGDGFVTITRGESIRSFFEHAEEAEEEEDDDSMDKDVNDLDGDGSRPQKHAKSPELAREFLLDAATVIFKDQVEKAFREGTARQNAHSVFVCLALKLLEERVHVACKEIITLEKQIKLLEEEEKEKQEEEERKERKRTKEREKKLRRKERLKGKDKKCAESKPLSCNSDPSGKEMSLNGPDEPYNSSSISGDSVSETGENGGSFTSLDEQPSEFMDLKVNTSEGNCLHHHPYNVDGDFIVRDGNGSYMTELSKYSRRKLRFRKDFITDPASKWCDRRNICVGQESNFQVHSSETKYHGYGTATSRCFNGLQKHQRNSALKFDTRNCGPKFAEKFHCSNNRTRDWSDFHSCSCDQHNIYRPKDGLRYSVLRSDRDIKNDGKSDATSDIYSKPNNGCYGYNKGTISRVRHTVPLSKGEILHARKVWEPLDLRKKNTKGDLEPDYSQASCNGGDNNSEKLESICQSFDDNCNSEISISLGKVDGSTNHQDAGNEVPSGNSYTLSREDGFQDGLCSNISPDPAETSSTPDSCSSCLSEGDSTAGSSGVPSAESLYNSDSEDTSQHSEGREASTYTENPSHKCQDAGIDEKVIAKGDESLQNDTTASDKGVFRKDITLENGHNPENGISKVDVGSEQACAMPVHNKNLQLPVLPAHSTMGYYHHNPAAWAAGPANGLMSYPHMNRYFFTGPFGYGIPANQSSHFCVQYGPTLQPMSDSMVNVHHLPTYQTGNKASPVVLEEPRKARIPGKKQEAKCLTATMVSEDPPKRTLPSNLVPQRSTKPQHDVNPSKSVGRSSNFSLFHFGGPVAVPSGDLRNQDQLLKSTGKVVKTDCSSAIKETSVEEYSLFAASNGPRFPFF